MTIFVSHSSSDAEAVRSLVQSLEAAGGRVWLDQDLTGGEAWWTAILRQIRECSVFVFALSENALQSEACLVELTYARDLGLPILPVQLGDLRGLRDHAIFAYQAIDYRNPTASAGIALVRAIQERERERQPLPDPLPPAPPPPYEYLMLLGTAINGRATLSPSEQESIVLQLRQALREEKNDAVRANVRTLLATLRERPEVTHRTVTEINTVLGAATAASGTPQAAAQASPQHGFRQPAQQPIQQPAPGWYPDPGGSQQLRYWDGRQWQQQTRVPANQASVSLLQQTTAKPSKALSILAFTLAGGALLIPFLGLGGIGLGIAAAVRKERMGRTALWVAVATTVIGFLVWTALYSR